MSQEFKDFLRTNEVKPGSVTAEPLNQLTLVPKHSTPEHEAQHAIIGMDRGLRVIVATCEEGDGYLGMTQFDKFDAPTAMGPESVGGHGTGSDVAKVIHMGHDPKNAASVARGILAYRKRDVQVAAALIWEKGTVSGWEIEQAIEDDKNPWIKIEAETTEGEKKHFVMRLKELEDYPINLTDRNN